MKRRLVVVTAAFVALVATIALVTACSSSGTKSTAGNGTALIGTFKLIAGDCHGAQPTGTYFRMITPSGTIENGKFFDNPDSTCSDKSITVEKPGSDGGLVAGSFQPNPAKPFDSFGNALSTSIVTPGTFTAIKFGISTNKVDPQTKKTVQAPTIYLNGSTLSGQISAWSAAWNNLYFNQGSPKPDGTRPGLTSPVSGTYDAATHHFVLTWASQVVGGPFNGFTGYWHLEGTFQPQG